MALHSVGELTATELAGDEVARTWELCIAEEFDHDDVVLGIAEWLGAPAGLDVLDCACGSGFPALDLHRLGYHMYCTDGSAFMLDRFLRKARGQGIPLVPRQVRWEKLGALYPAAFDVVLCRGCSLIYAGTWDTDAEPDWLSLVISVENFVQCLRPGGRLYVDTTREEDLYGGYPQVEEHPARIIDGHKVEWSERLTADPEAGIRCWRVSLCIDGTPIEFERKSHYVAHEKFVKVLKEAGLAGVGRVEIPGERYAVFVGHRPRS